MCVLRFRFWTSRFHNAFLRTYSCGILTAHVCRTSMFRWFIKYIQFRARREAVMNIMMTADPLVPESNRNGLVLFMACTNPATQCENGRLWEGSLVPRWIHRRLPLASCALQGPRERLGAFLPLVWDTRQPSWLCPGNPVHLRNH